MRDAGCFDSTGSLVITSGTANRSPGSLLCSRIAVAPELRAIRLAGSRPGCLLAALVPRRGGTRLVAPRSFAHGLAAHIPIRLRTAIPTLILTARVSASLVTALIALSRRTALDRASRIPISRRLRARQSLVRATLRSSLSLPAPWLLLPLPLPVPRRGGGNIIAFVSRR